MFGITRKWRTAFILAMAVALLSSLLVTGHSTASPLSAGGSKEPTQPSGGGMGDPDVPTGSTARSSTVGAQRQEARPNAAATVGDGRMSRDTVWMWRLRIVLQGLRAYTFRF